MKSTRLLFRIVCIALVVISILGLFEPSAFNFLKESAKKNTEFLAAISEIKILVSGLSSVNIPFVSGHTEGLSETLGKVQNYLLFTDSITFTQILLLSISKSFIFKAFLIVLLVLSFIEKTKQHFTKILILALALSPGASLFTVAVKHISNEIQMDYGAHYLKELKASANEVKNENTKLMEEHNTQLTKINNGQKGLIFFQKFKEDVAYDVKKVESSIKGDYYMIRKMIKTAGHSITEKVFRFCNMMLFSFLILPIGYALFIYVLFNSLFKGAELNANLVELIKQGENEVSNTGVVLIKKSFSTKMLNIFKAIRNEFKTAVHEVEVSSVYRKAKDEAQQLEGKVEEAFKHKKQQVVADIDDEMAATETKAEQFYEREKNKVVQDVENTEDDIKTRVEIEEGVVKSHAEQLYQEEKGKVITDVDNEVNSK